MGQPDPVAPVVQRRGQDRTRQGVGTAAGRPGRQPRARAQSEDPDGQGPSGGGTHRWRGSTPVGDRDAMTEEERAALAALRLTWAPVPDDVWQPLPLHVDGLHTDVVQELLAGITDAKTSPGPSPLGIALLGRRGSGKTHLLGWLRQRVQEQGGYFFLVSLLDEQSFWPSVLAYLLDGLARPVPGSGSQLRLLLRRLSSRIGAPRAARRAVMGETGLTRPALDAFIDGLTASDPYVAGASRDTARALALRASDTSEHRDVADNYFVSGEEAFAGGRTRWGMRGKPRTAEEIVRELSLLLALTGPSVIAVDQIDTLVAQSSLSGDLALNTDTGAEQRQAAELEIIAGGLMALRERTRRTLTVVACLPPTWSLIEERATHTVRDRFRQSPVLKGILRADIAQQIVERRFTARYREIGFTPRYRTWPVRQSAFADAEKYTPRRLLVEIDQHVRTCLKAGKLTELKRLSGVREDDQEPGPPAIVGPEVPDAILDRIGSRFEQLRRAADVTSPLESDTEDATFPGLLAAGLTAWILERGDDAEAFTVDPPPSANPDLHARRRRTLSERTEDQVHWCFRAVSDTHHAIAALTRVRRARTAAGLTAEVSKRKLFLIRNGPWSSGVKTQQAIREFRQDGGMTLGVDDADLRVLAALRGLRDENPTELRAWLVRRRPTAELALFKEALADVDGWTPDGPPPAVPVPDFEVTPKLVLGYGSEDGAPVPVPLEALRKHVAIFAGSGSGKTVLVRRLAEESALQGVSAIILDPNNDLARLGDPWPDPPASWGAEDAERAADYLANTEVLVWTPRRETGRPLSFQPLPDFGSVREDPDEFGEAVEAAVAALAPRANLVGRTNKTHLGLAVLRRAVEHFGRQGGRGVQGLVDVLADLPDGVTGLNDADRIAAGLAQTLTASMVNDPLLGLFVMDEAKPLAPSGAMPACTQSTLALAAQARKYGLGLIFATQAPKGLHNRIPGNATTQFFGLLNAPVQIEAAREMAKVKGGDVPALGRLASGEVYVAVEGEAPQKVRRG